MNNTSKAVSLQNIVREYVSPDKTVFRAVNDVSLEIASGEFVTLLGPSGCGKTTTLRMIAGFEIPTSGKLFIGGEDVTTQSPDKRDTAMVFQSYALFPHYNVYNNISFGLRLRKVKEKEITQRTNQIMELVGLQGLGERFPNQLSGGQQQRVAIARALALNPQVLCFDEPTSALDPELTGEVLRVIRGLKEQNTTMIVVTHEMDFARSVADVVIYMADGVIEEMGTPEEVFDHPVSEKTRHFIQGTQQAF